MVRLAAQEMRKAGLTPSFNGKVNVGLGAAVVPVLLA